MKVTMSSSRNRLINWIRQTALEPGKLKSIHEAWDELPASEKEQVCLLAGQVNCWVRTLEQRSSEGGDSERGVFPGGRLAESISQVHATLLTVSFREDSPLAAIARAAVTIFVARAAGREEWDNRQLQLLWKLFIEASSADREMVAEIVNQG